MIFACTLWAQQGHFSSFPKPTCLCVVTVTLMLLFLLLSRLLQRTRSGICRPQFAGRPFSF